MRLKLKSIFRRVFSRRKDDQLKQSHAEEQHTNATAGVAQNTNTQSKLLSTKHGDLASRSNVQNRKGGHGNEKSSRSVQRSLNHHQVADIAGSGSTQLRSDDIDRSVAEDYEAYLPVISTMESGNNNNPLNNEKYNTSSEATGGKADNLQRKDAVADISFTSGPLEISLQSDSDKLASSASSIYSTSPKYFENSYPIATTHRHGKEQSVQSTATPVLSHDESKMATASKDHLSEEVIGENLHKMLKKDDIINPDTQGALDNEAKVPESFDVSNLNGIIDLKDSVDIDKRTKVAPAVQHEIIKPTEHEIIEERIFREIHNHNVYHYILPVKDVEILPARHFVHDSNGELVEVSGNPFPHLGGIEKRWEIVKKRQDAADFVPQLPLQTEPRIIADETYMTEEGYSRRETTILHPPELEDLTGYEGPVMPIVFTHISPEAPEQTNPGKEKSYDSMPPKSLWLRELIDELPSSLD